MNQEEYNELYEKALALDDDFEPVQLDYDILPGETRGQAQTRCLTDLGILIPVVGGYLIDSDAAAKYDPNLLKVLEALAMAETLAALDKQVEEGKLILTVNDEGYIVYAPKAD